MPSSRFSAHPPVIRPASRSEPSNTNSCHVPFGSVPLNSAKELPWGGLGAGGGPWNPNPSRLALELGLYVPLVTLRPSFRGTPSSSNVSVRPMTLPKPPTPLIRSTLCPPGPTRTTSTSEGKACSNPSSSTFRSVTTPRRSETSIADGYGVAVPDLGITIACALETVVGGDGPVGPGGGDGGSG